MEWTNYQGKDNLKVLVVFPNVKNAIQQRRKALGLPEIEIAELEYGSEEVGELVNRLHATLLPGKRATIHGLLDVLEEGWDVIWLITHGEKEGWYLSDGLVNVSEMTSLIRSSGTFLTVMNTCSSYEVAAAAAEELGTAFICTLSEVPDRQAFITGVLFAQKLAAGYDYVTAYELARPGQKHPYVLIEARKPMRQERPERGRSNQPLDRDTFQQFVESVKELDQIINGSTRLGLPALKDIRQVVENLQDDLQIIKVQLGDYDRRQRMRAYTMWTMAAILLVLTLIVTLIASKQGLLL